MKLLVLSLAILATWALPAAIAAPTMRYDTQAAMDFACSVMDYDCSQIAPPSVAVTPNLFTTYGAFGGYSGGEVVYLDGYVLAFAKDEYVQSVLAHEVTHYLDTKLGYVDLNDRTALCTTEANGWRVGNAYVISHGLPEFADFEWYIRYGCFQ